MKQIEMKEWQRGSARDSVHRASDHRDFVTGLIAHDVADVAAAVVSVVVAAVVAVVDAAQVHLKDLAVVGCG